MLKEFKEFAMRGNVLDMAVGVILGASFGTIVNSAVGDLLMPLIGKLTGGIDFKDLFLALDGQTYKTMEEARKAAAPALAYGAFANSVVNFLIIAFAVFLLVRQVNRFRRAAPPAPPSSKECPLCLSAIPLKATRCAHCTSAVPG
jgi:large conductance mechanosensitive channel